MTSTVLLLPKLEQLLAISSSSTSIKQILINLAVSGQLSEQREDESVENWIDEFAENKDDLSCPPNWRMVQLGKLGRIYNGSSLSDTEKKLLEKTSNGIPFLATKDIGYATSNIDYKNGWLVPEGNQKYKRAKAGTLLICLEGGSAGKKMGIVNQEVCFGNKMFAIDLKSGVLPEYLQIVYQSLSFQSAFALFLNGIISGISKAKFEKLICPIPPLKEQIRIVDTYESLLSLVGTMNASRIESQDYLFKSRESLIDSLINNSYGDLFRGEYSNFIDRFSLYANDVKSLTELRKCFMDLVIRGAFSKGFDELSHQEEDFWKLPQGWNWVPLSKLIDSGRGISYGIIKLGKEPKASGVPVLRCSDVKYRKFDLSGMRKVEPSISQQYSRTVLKGGEVLVNIRGTLGGCAVVPSEFAGFNIAREVAAMMPLEVTAEYLLTVLSSNYFTKHVINSLRGISYKGMNLALLRKTMIPVPPKDEELRLVAIVNETMLLFDTFEKSIQMKLKIREELENVLEFELVSKILNQVA